MGTMHSLMLQHFWSLSISLFNVTSRTLEQGGLPPCRDAFHVFYSAIQMGHRTLAGWMGEGLTPLLRCSRCILQPQLTGLQNTCWLKWREVLPLCWDVVGVFYSSIQLGHRTLIGWSRGGGSYLLCWDTVGRYILQLQPTGLKFIWT